MSPIWSLKNGSISFLFVFCPWSFSIQKHLSHKWTKSHLCFLFYSSSYSIFMLASLSLSVYLCLVMAAIYELIFVLWCIPFNFLIMFNCANFIVWRALTNSSSHAVPCQVNLDIQPKPFQIQNAKFKWRRKQKSKRPTTFNCYVNQAKEK